MDDLIYWIGLNSISGIGPRKTQILLKSFGSPREVFRASEDLLCKIEGIDRTSVEVISNGFDEEFSVSQIEIARQKNIQIVTLAHRNYPKLLRELYDPPSVLYIRGEIRESDEKALAVVGTRNLSSYGRRATEMITGELAAAGVTIVSGMARGIDSVAHKSAIDSGGRTIAVLGCGVDTCYPAQNRALMERIAQNGAIVSEFPIGTEPETYHFPRRNRIISGLSRGVLITEAGASSGALITADFALEQGRDVFAIPGPITMPSFDGSNRLLQNGAGLITSAQDIFNSMKRYMGSLISNKKEAATPQLSKEENNVYKHLSYEPIHIDILSQKCNLQPSRVLGTLLGLELRGIIQQLAGKNFVKTQ